MRSGVLMVAVIIFPHNVIQVQQLKKMIVGRRRSRFVFSRVCFAGTVGSGQSVTVEDEKCLKLAQVDVCFRVTNVTK